MSEQWQQPQDQPQWGGGGQAPQQTSGKATAALVLGIVSILCVPLIAGIIGVIIGGQAKKEIDSSGGRLGGRGMAQAGVILSWIGIAWGVLVIILAVAGAFSS
ncbi:DUF4190 domain-containing protein [Solirubrobacter phytolaccae]|uniref:DUF4190 domain-containing protein n=1 Tax=Solirubrobacter phytolaccae TaxID=1404360 RepID=A0A9X3SAQ6_9ACTN|nr:DUF4190 domain-containing protein [Solirubrobacter phytolaccae]MDA0184729.1 DUF4190 domain-containing protein [Solirubrobacter phytolaccae]